MAHINASMSLSHQACYRPVRVDSLPLGT